MGAGALGRVLAIHLIRGGADVAFWDARARGGAEDIVSIRTADDPDVTHRVPCSAVPSDADVVIVTVRAEDLTTGFADTLRGSAPVVVFTPLLPGAEARLRAGGLEPIPAMPSIAAEIREGTLHWWLPPAASRIQEQAGVPAIAQLQQALQKGGLPARVTTGVAARNCATTALFFPLQVAVCCANGALPWMEDASLYRQSMRATKECRRLARHLGSPEPGMLVLSYLAPYLRWARRWLSSFFPTAFHYITTHFGGKLAAQHRALHAELTALAAVHRVPTPNLDQLMKRLPT